MTKEKDLQNYNELLDSKNIEPFENSQEAWFWFCQANEAKTIGAKCSPGMGEVSRPCEPEDILNIVNKLHKNRMLLMDHIRILAHYGKRLCAPNLKRNKEQLAYTLWDQAFKKLEPIFLQKGIIKQKEVLC